VTASHQEERVTVSFDEAQAGLDAIKAKITSLGYQVRE